MKTNSLNILFVLMIFLFASCQKESLTVQEEGAITGLAAKNLKAARVIDAAETCTTCIDAENPVYYPETGDFESSWGGPNDDKNKKTMNYEVYNTLSGFVVKLSKSSTTGNSPTAVQVTVGTGAGAQTQVLIVPNSAVAPPTVITHTFALPAGWQYCDGLAWSFTEITTTINGTNYAPQGGNPIAGGGTYYLHAACVDCTESFTYVDNGDKTYTFSYTPEEDMDDAALVFTFAQGVAVSGLGAEWTTNGSTRQTTMDLVACETYTWTVGLTADCSGNSANSNVWTDFKVNLVSKKANVEDKFTQTCPQ